MSRFGLRGAKLAPQAAPAPVPAPTPEPKAVAAPAPALAPAPAAPTPPKAAPNAKGAPPSQLDIRLRLHARLIDELDLAKLDKLDPQQIQAEVMKLTADFARAERMALNAVELKDLGASSYD